MFIGEKPSDKETIFHEVFLHMDESYQQNIGKISVETDKKVLIVNAGGAIGMIQTATGFSMNKVAELKKLMKSIPHLCDQNHTFFNSEGDFLITPPSLYGKRVRYQIEQYNHFENFDGTDPNICLQIAETIEKNYEAYDAFIILHNTDTMAYTASSLSFMLENLSKTVILTGSYVPLSASRNDAFENLLGALTIAGHFTIPEVSIYFCNKLLRGNRAIKVDSFGLEGFDVPNSKPLAVFGTGLKIEWDIVSKLKREKFTVQKQLNQKVGILKLYPSIPLKLVKNILEADIEACVIESFGAGDLPFKKLPIMEQLKKATDQGKILVVITQCSKGAVYAHHTSTEQYTNLGLTPGLDMTGECATAKLAYLLGKGYSKDQVKEMIQKDLRGEVSEEKPMEFEGKKGLLLQDLAGSLREGASNSVVKNGLFPTLTSYAAHFGFVNVLDQLRDYGTSLESGDYEGRTPLHIAAGCGKINVVEHLIAQKVNLNTIDKLERSALFEAILNKEFKTAQVLIDAGARVMAKKKDICNLLFKLIAKGDLESLKLLYNGGLNNLEQYVNIDKRTIAHIACAENQVEIIDFLRNQVNFDFSVKDRWNQTPLIDEVRVRRDSFMKELDEKGSDLKEFLFQQVNFLSSNNEHRGE